MKVNEGVPHSVIGDICIGTVLSELGGSKAARSVALMAGLPTSSALSTVNRACSSGLAAISNIAHSIALGEIECGIGGGMESMSRNYGTRAIPTQVWNDLQNTSVKDAGDCMMSMGLTAENVAERYGVNRDEQDKFAANSHGKALKAQRDGLFDEEIVHVPTFWSDPKAVNAKPQPVTITKDDGIRETTLSKLASMKPAFKENGTATAGNSSQISDGAAAALLMSRSTASNLGLESRIIGKWAGTQVIGCRPDEMGIGPLAVIPKLLDYVGLSQADIGLWEINEAFASQTIHCIRALEIDFGKVNPKGGAIALGHPLGATGARQLATLLPEMKRQDVQLGVVSMCGKSVSSNEKDCCVADTRKVGTGMGMAALFVRE